MGKSKDSVEKQIYSMSIRIASELVTEKDPLIATKLAAALSILSIAASCEDANVAQKLRRLADSLRK